MPPSSFTLTHLIKRKHFLAVKAGKRRSGALFSLEFLFRRDNNPASRIGFTVTKKAGNAVCRNRIRRKLREAMRVHAAYYMQPGFDYVIIGRKELLYTPFKTIVAELSHRISQTSG